MNTEIHFRIRRQDGPNAAPYWEEFKMPHSPGHNVVSALMYLREHPENIKGEKVNPVVWDSNCMEEVCGACSMLINGVPRQACAALVDDLLVPAGLDEGDSPSGLTGVDLAAARHQALLSLTRSRRPLPPILMFA